MIVLKWNDNKGFTLVELIISIAVMSVVALTITILMQTGSKSFSNAKSELNVQMESQTLLAQINTMIMESNSVHYDKDNDILTLYQIDSKSVAATAGSIGANKDGFVETKTVKKMKFVKYDSAKQELYLYEHDHDQIKPASGGSISCAPECALYDSDALFAEYVNKFEVTINGSNVNIHLGMKKQNSSYEVDATSKIRNKLITYP